MRVIAGRLRGRKLTPPADQRVRPTSDRLRETLFNMLAHGVDLEFDGALVADFFAGTGALGIEALSRGAKAAVFMDLERASLDLLQRNLQDLGLTSVTRILRGDARSLPRATAPVDCIFLDPPYGQNLIPPVIEAAQNQGWLKPGCVIVMETAVGEDLPLPGWLEILKDRNVGGSRLVIAEVGV
ncbi:16S rRNA (guanine(966)-N(2))-methyltransferase RsmD [Govanella unica]|uniref:16S rRNA (Guanine(966)-N(2))-methyltransferase RsmD n=1 Tax=Govanella unica TaxID=2975056 RepID=A0A9X3TX86_9PROT|nr:16S rRNA (guanine(966)-N(2))-methyltransferase RsmD [Govania unica]MDA5193328.1 16S rRNA (guanine(966)-N(2))-methyltransferase RsmD [Govania unica]